MIVSHEWLKQFVPHTRTAAEIGDVLSRHCVTLDGIHAIGADLSAFVVAQVVEAKRHPNSDHLWVTKVDDGGAVLLDVVCGAPNVVAGAKYPFARTGTVMPAGLKIEKRKIRGETSNGMLCSARELGLGEEHDGILTLDTDAAPGAPLLTVMPPADAQLDLDVLPNRPDLLSHRGVARELQAVLGIECALFPTGDLSDVDLQILVQRGEREITHDGVHVQVHDLAQCPQYIAVIIRGVRVGPSPTWLVNRLASIGQRSISNVVDATNYVLHGLGQPMHAFDLAKLSGSTIAVRPSRAGETLVTLDGVSRPIAEGTTVICDAERPVALAGVMGGRETEVTDETTDILLEVAHFDPRFVRRVRRAVGLSTDASYRYERGVDAGATMELALFGAALIVQVAGGAVSSVLAVGAEPADAAPVMLRPARLARVLGVEVSAEEIARRLTVLGCSVQRTDDALLVQPPTWRQDLLLEVDLIEEVARLVGFDTLPDELRPFRPGTAPDHPLHLAGRRVRDALVAMGLAEIRPMPFTSTGDANAPRVRNPLADDEPFLRASLLDTLARRAEYNLTRNQGNVRIFEVGNAFLPTGGRLPREEVRVAALVMGARRPSHFTEPEPPTFDAWDAKALAERVFAAAYEAGALTFGDGRRGLVPGEGDVLWRIYGQGGEVVGQVVRVPLDRPVWAAEAFGLELMLGVIASDDVAPAGVSVSGQDSGTVAAPSRTFHVRSLPSTPAAEFDLALLVPDGTTAAGVEQVLRGAGGELLERVVLFDEYRGEGVPAGTRSLAYRFTFRHPDRTLGQKEIDGRRSRVLESLDRELGIRPRAS